MPESTTLTGSRPVAGVSVLLPSNCSAPEPSNGISPRLAVRCGLQACKPERDKLTEATDPQGNRRPFAAGGAAPYLSFVVPVYGSPESLEPLAQRVKDVCAGMGVSYELILVDDRCPKNSWLSIKRLAEDDHAIVGISLSRNFGQHAAIQAGLSRVRGEWVVVMDCDLQDRPEEVPKLWAKALEGFDVVRAKRANRSDPWYRRFFSRVFYTFLSYLTDTHQSPQFSNFGIYNRRVIEVITQWQEEFEIFSGHRFLDRFFTIGPGGRTGCAL